MFPSQTALTALRMSHVSHFTALLVRSAINIHFSSQLFPLTRNTVALRDADWLFVDPFESREAIYSVSTGSSNSNL